MHANLAGADSGFREGGLAVELLNFACEIHGSSEAERSFSCCDMVVAHHHVRVRVYRSFLYCLGFNYSDEGGG